jgi:hypothetical protein
MAGNAEPMHFCNSITRKQFKYSHSIAKIDQLKQTQPNPNSASTSRENRKAFVRKPKFAHNRSSANSKIDSCLNDFEASKKKHSKDAEEIKLVPNAPEVETVSKTVSSNLSPNLKRSRNLDMVLCSNYRKWQKKWFHFDASGNGCVIPSK